MAVFFAILFQGRTGSSHLQECLDSHPNIKCDPEILVHKPADVQQKTVDDFFAIKYPENIAAAGFKTKLKDIHLPEIFGAQLHKYNVKIIHMSRENLVKQAFSKINAQRLFDERKLWNLPKDQPPLKPVNISILQFQEALDHHNNQSKNLEDFITKTKLPVLKVFYEEILEDEEKTQRKICDYLGTNYVRMQSKLRKNTPENLREMVLNYDEIKNRFTGTEYEKLF